MKYRPWDGWFLLFGVLEIDVLEKRICAALGFCAAFFKAID